MKDPVIYVHPLCPFTTPFDVTHNRSSEKIKIMVRPGWDSEQPSSDKKISTNYFVQDLYIETVLIAKLKAIANYYNATNSEEEIDYFVECVREIINYLTIEF